MVATPIGNLDDISARALKILADVALIAAEDTRHSIRLLQHFGINTPLAACHEHNERDEGSRFLTHMKKLKDPVPGLERFFERIEALGKKLGPIVFQLPPRFKVNLERLEAFLAIMPNSVANVFEFREPSWYCEAVYALLD